MVSISASQIVPPEFQAQLQNLGEVGDESSYGIGDLTVILEDELQTVPKGQLHNAIGQFCNRAGVTIADYGLLSRRVPKHIRDRYDMLGRHHHRAIASIALGDETKHAALSDAWLEKADDYGGNIGPVWALRAWLADQNGAPEAWLGRLRRARKLCALLAGDERAPFEVREFANDFDNETKVWDN